MTGLKKVLRWLGMAAILQSLVICLLSILFTRRLSNIHNGVTDALFASNAATERIDIVNQSFFSLTSLAVWFLIAGIAFTTIG